MKKKHNIAFFHPAGEEVKTRIDFDSEIEETLIYELLKLEGYLIYQFILPDYQYVMSFDELSEQGIRFKLFEKERRTWFGLSKKVEQELLIYPKDGFFYPYQYGTYFYLFSREEIKENEFLKWMDKQFPNRWTDFDETFAGLNSDTMKFLHEPDYILVTNYDYQKEFGIVASKEICAALIARLKQAAFQSFEAEEYIQNKE
ncbi:hypothetical protein [Pontibacter flavimaris]|uniref:Uncharacterized protein n=1 Tax=Pontibacter flavimaris TaxID=1797110 RepID=A0A1Q5PFV7_9BACT|nr:hypothetical protein [Pontibacter flavimaris]OKL41125.1 hypothetical protein A3841_14975 [Pontibacter flavimaris]